MRKFLERTTRHYFFWIGAVLFIAVVSEFYFLGTINNYAEGLLFDWRARLNTTKVVDQRVVMTRIDNYSMLGTPSIRLKGLGRFPWPRKVWAHFLSVVRKSGVKLVIFDVLFEDKMAGDGIMASEMAKGPPVVLAETIHENGISPALVSPPIPAFQKRASGSGFINFFTLSAPVREIPTVVETEKGNLEPSLDLAAVRYLLGNPQLRAGDGYVALGRRSWPAYGKDHNLLIRWATFSHSLGSTASESPYGCGQIDSSQSVSVLDVLANPALGNCLKGKILLVGAWDLSLQDQASTPAGVKFGSEIHANVINALLGNLCYRDAGPMWNWVALLVPSLALAFLLMKLNAHRRLILATVFVAGYVGLNDVAFSHGVWLHLAGPSFSMVLIYAGSTLHHTLEAERKKNEISKIYGRYLAPQVKEQLIADYEAEKAELHGALRELTILESDIRGFTTLSENLPPEEVVRLLNVYFTAMIPILYQHGGTWDKFVGDALLAYFGAPGHQPDHAERAVACAVEMLEVIETMRNLGDIPFHVGIGINTGEVKVGHIGADATSTSEEQKQYTVIGDTVNLAARLCGHAEGGTLLISEATYKALDGRFYAEPLGPISVKGKAQEVNVYLIRRKNEPAAG